MHLFPLNLSSENVKYPARKHFEKTNSKALKQKTNKQLGSGEIIVWGLLAIKMFKQKYSSYLFGIHGIFL